MLGLAELWPGAKEGQGVREGVEGRRDGSVRQQGRKMAINQEDNEAEKLIQMDAVEVNIKVERG